MSAIDPPLQERVYHGLKADFLAGHFVPGKRIDIQDLANRHHSSKTPVREAAFIFVGEGLFVHHADGGFLVPILEPAELIELLDWHMQLLIAVLTTLKESAVRRALQPFSIVGGEASAVGAALRATEIFSSLAEATGNRHATHEVRRLNERLHYSRITETAETTGAEKELALFASMEVRSLRRATRRRVEAYHARKIAHLEKIIQLSQRRDKAIQSNGLEVSADPATR
ncbi:GntR family transcriptional regulator [Sphingomonas sp. H39-1-10]|uniref:GntR family transcriptional regulator n=1 Tax=Sphingomonas pollutisoli TaxID=3030829 RepID=UPI0023BA08FA|nr:GntR family transcriptional regulator [Sphingomonas pollutisoli]MDF0490257.1 GntR family transcriptional regulator [Sphingomonas pollutisoli]